MRVPLQWLADYVEVTLPIEDLGHRLTMGGLKVETIERIGSDWQDVVAGQVIEIQPHPTSRNPLWVARVDLGDRLVTIVTGAQNVRASDKVPVVPVGGVLPHGPEGRPIVIEARPMAGIPSEGMLASERELGLSDEHTGIVILPDDAPVGAPVSSLLGDDVIEIETTPNRPDTLSMIGVAREVAALTEQQLTPPDVTAISGSVEWLDEESFPVQVEAPELCPRYSALRIEGVRVEASPSWVAERLTRAGMRPINLLVDLTNYVMLECGQPMHAFDARLLRERIVVRRAHPGEELRTLDGVNRALSADNLVIADAERAVAVAGVMGGEESEITPETTSIVLESANFDAVSVRSTAKALNLRTESSSRFEKTLPPEETVPALSRYLQLLAQITEHPLRVARVTDVWVGPPPAREVSMPLRDLHRLVGVQIDADTAAEALSLLGFGVTLRDDAVAAVVPSWRRADVFQSADLVEEVARIVGYDAVPSTLPRGGTEPPPLPPELYWEGQVRERLLSGGANEATTHSLTSEISMARLGLAGSTVHQGDAAEMWSGLVPNPAGVYAREAQTLPVHLKNPATQDRQVLRLTLLPSLLDVIAQNLKQTDERVEFFELDRTFFVRPHDLPYERRTLALALSGSRPRSWQQPEPGPVTFYDLKGMLESVLGALQIDGWEVDASPHPALHPGRSAALRLRGHDVGFFGQLHPEVAASFDIENWPVQVAEVDLDALFEVASDVHQFRPLPRFPAARRDIAVVVQQGVPAGEIMRAIRDAAGPLLESATIFDVYAGDPLPEGMKSIAVGMSFRAPSATLTQDEIADVMDRIVRGLASELGASIRE